jgi:hypothetical protein
MAGFSINYNEHSGSIQVVEFLGQLKDNRLLKKDSGPGSESFNLSAFSSHRGERLCFRILKFWLF